MVINHNVGETIHGEPQGERKLLCGIPAKQLYLLQNQGPWSFAEDTLSQNQTGGDLQLIPRIVKVDLASILLAVCISGVQIQFLILMPTWRISLVPRRSLHFAQLGHLSNPKESYSGLGWPVYGPFQGRVLGASAQPRTCQPLQAFGGNGLWIRLFGR